MDYETGDTDDDVDYGYHSDWSYHLSRYVPMMRTDNLLMGNLTPGTRTYDLLHDTAWVDYTFVASALHLYFEHGTLYLDHEATSRLSASCCNLVTTMYRNGQDIAYVHMLETLGASDLTDARKEDHRVLCELVVFHALGAMALYSTAKTENIPDITKRCARSLSNILVGQQAFTRKQVQAPNENMTDVADTTAMHTRTNGNLALVPRSLQGVAIELANYDQSSPEVAEPPPVLVDVTEASLLEGLLVLNWLQPQHNDVTRQKIEILYDNIIRNDLDQVWDLMQSDYDGDADGDDAVNQHAVGFYLTGKETLRSIASNFTAQTTDSDTRQQWWFVPNKVLETSLSDIQLWVLGRMRSPDQSTDPSENDLHVWSPRPPTPFELLLACLRHICVLHADFGMKYRIVPPQDYNPYSTPYNELKDASPIIHVLQHLPQANLQMLDGPLVSEIALALNKKPPVF